MTDKYIGQILDNRYEILQVIGTGGMAVVYKALCHRLNRYVAVKILKDEYAKDEGFRNRFRAESHAVAMLSHPNIVAVYDVSKSSSIEYIVMELVDGMTLKQYMERRGTLSQKAAVHFTTQILKALSHAHSKGIIHRDIKPHNIMLLRDSTVKVTDFGIARLESSQRTITREAFGSVHYIAPEQAKGSNIDCRADIYSTGVVLYEMLTGRVPYEGDTPVSIAIQHINSLPLSPREINPEVNETLEKITMKAMASSPSRRYSSTDEMLKDMLEYKKNPNVYIDYTPPVQMDDVDKDETRKIEISEEPELDIPKKETSWKNKIPLLAAIVSITVFVIGVFCLIALFSGGFGNLFSGCSTKTEDVLKTPSLIGVPFEEAQNLYDDFEIIELDEASRKYSEKYAAGVIIDQKPIEGKENKQGKIYVTISKGKKKSGIKIPDLRGLNREQAILALDSEGLIMVVETETSDSVKEGLVIRTDPEQDTVVSEASSVTVYISLGEELKEIEAPDLLGKTVDEATELLTELNLETGKVSYKNDDKEKGLIISQSINPGDKISESTEIDYVVSLGPKSSLVSQPKGDDEPTESDPNTSEVQKVCPVRLPATPESFEVKVTVNGSTQYKKTHNASDGTVNVTLKGKGVSVVRVYVNDNLHQEIEMDFN